MWPRVVVLLLASALAGAPLAQAAQFTEIKYHLSGVIQLQAPTAFTRPIYSPDAPAPENVQQPTGSMVTFRFESQGGVPLVSGDVTLLSFVQSNGVTMPGLATGYNRLELAEPLTGGHLSGKTAGGPVQGTGSNNGFFHCIASPAACYGFFDIDFWSFRTGRGANTTIYERFWTPYNEARPGFPIFFNGRASGSQGTPVDGAGWVFNSAFSALTANRPFCTNHYVQPQPGPTGTGCSALAGTVVLVGTEVSRLVTPEPSPLLTLAAWGALGGALLALRTWLRP